MDDTNQSPEEQIHDLVYAFMKEFIDAGDIGLSKFSASDAYLYFGRFVLRYEFKDENLKVSYFRMNPKDLEKNEIEGYSLNELVTSQVTDEDRAYVVAAEAKTKMEEAAALHFSTLLNRCFEILAGDIKWLQSAPKADLPGEPMNGAIRIALRGLT